jgi:UDP-GlcNAc:undecaprenyl-phosphate GlcNAc-1-phosphate transferase
VTIHPSHTVLALSLALCLACCGFLPFNLRPGRRAATFMGDSGSQVLGFLLAAFGLASSWKVAGTTVATLLLPILILAVPILDTTLVTVVRLLEGRPIYQGGRDHTSHRLVGRGLSETRAVILLALVAGGLGATSLAYSVLNDQRVTLLGVLITFALLVQFGSFLAEAERSGGVPRTLVVNPRRLVEVLIDFALISAAFAAAYALTVGHGLPWYRHMATVSLPAVLFARYVAFIPFGLYRGVWRYAGARDAINVVLAVAASELAAFVFIDQTQIWNGFPKTIFVVDALFAILFVGASRFAERFLERGLAGLRDRGSRRRTLIVGAGRGGRSLMRELRETPGEQVIGFVDDDVRLRRRRLQGVPVLGGIEEIGWVIGRTQPEAVLVTIPNAPRERLDAVIEACTRAGIPCGFVRREVELDPRVVLGTAGK